ncbi:hypothetical protein evm_011510 [Chilo suppressalis]|nr:hypothetical protein evm_011510 [Chilo suppressalis]
MPIFELNSGVPSPETSRGTRQNEPLVEPVYGGNSDDDCSSTYHHYHHHQPIDVPTAGAQAFPMDGIGRLGHDPPRVPITKNKTGDTSDISNYRPPYILGYNHV